MLSPLDFCELAILWLLTVADPPYHSRGLAYTRTSRILSIDSCDSLG